MTPRGALMLDCVDINFAHTGKFCARPLLFTLEQTPINLSSNVGSRSRLGEFDDYFVAGKLMHELISARQVCIEFSQRNDFLRYRWIDTLWILR